MLTKEQRDNLTPDQVIAAVSDIRQQSNVLSGLERDGKIKVIGSMYHLVGGKVEFL